jgi:hypothetical protein
VAITSDKELSKLLELLDEKSRALIWHLWWHRHADIATLGGIIGAQNDFEVLYRLKERINKGSWQLFGKDIVKFEQSRVDPATGMNVSFHWWFLEDEETFLASGTKPVVDIIDEQETVMIIAQLPTSVSGCEPQVQVKQGILQVRLKKKYGTRGNI